MGSNRREILFRTCMGVHEGAERRLSDAVATLEVRVDETTRHPDGAVWSRLSGFLAEHGAEGRVVAGLLGYELLHLIEDVPRRERTPRSRPFADLHLGAFARDELVQLPPLREPARVVAPAPLPASVEAELTPGEYRRRVRIAREAILEGELFEVCFTQAFSAPCGLTAVELHERLRGRSPAASATLFQVGDHAVVSNSPELLLRVRGDLLESRPIKGTCPRDLDAGRDAELAAELLASEKDLAELAMIVDVTRNDLGRVAARGTVRVVDPVRLHSVANVHHLEALVTARLRPGRTALDAIRAIFPGGSVTGAPKVRAMQEIASLEASPRGPYCGALAVFEPGGNADLSVAIRTGTLAAGRFHFHSGGAVTAESDPEREHAEMLQKAAAIVCALTGGGPLP